MKRLISFSSLCSFSCDYILFVAKGVMATPLRPVTRLLGLSFLLVQINQCFAQTANSDFIAASDTLFPESTKWLSLAQTPTLSPSQLKKIKNSLEQAYRVALMSSKNHLEGQGCSFIQRVLTSSNSADFHQFDIDRDGIPDIIYSGNAHCSEGDATVIWFGAIGKYVVRQPFPLSHLLLRFSLEESSATAISRGCCGDPMDEYSLDALLTPRKNSALRMVNKTMLPPKKLDRPLPFITKSEVKLRTNPEIFDSYDQAKSEFLGSAAFGNVIRIYLSGSKGIVLGEANENKRIWIFVVMDAGSDALVSQDPYGGVRAGWLIADETLLIKK